MKELTLLAVLCGISLGVHFMFHAIERSRKEQDFKNVLNLVMLDMRTGHITAMGIDRRDTEALQLDDFLLTVVFQVDEKDPDVASLKFIDRNGEHQDFGLTMRSTTFTYAQYRCTALRNEENVRRAVLDLEADYFGLEEGPEFPPQSPVDEVDLVADAPTWCFVFAKRGALDHVVLTPMWWRHLRSFFDEERMRSLPKARHVFWRAGVDFDDASDRPVNSPYRQLPTREEVQAFADGIGKTIVLFVADGNGFQELTVQRKFLVKPRSNSLSQNPVEHVLRGFSFE